MAAGVAPDGVTQMTAMSPAQAVHHITSSNPTFALVETEIRGVPFRVFQNAPPNLRALMQASREPQGNGTADYLVYQDETWTYDEFCHETNRMAHVLQQNMNIRPGDRVAIAMRNCPELLTLTMAISSLGAVVVFLNAWWTTQELKYALTDTGAQVVFADSVRIERLKPLVSSHSLRLIGVRDGEPLCDFRYGTLRDAMRDDSWPEAPIDPDDDFAIMYSSGTTSHPKGVVQTHRGAINAVFTWLMQAAIAPLIAPPAEDAPPPPRPAVLVVTPLFHVTATHPVFLLSLPAGAKLALMEKWDATRAACIIRDEKITRFLGVPTQSADLLTAATEMNEPLETLDYLGSGGAKRPAAQVVELARKFPNANIATGWGMTETNAVGIGLAGPEYLERPGVAGRLHPPVQDLQFLDEDGQPVPQGEIGEITVKSPCNMRCYLNKPEATAEVLQDGWLRTGDLGYIDPEGYVTIVDRKKNIIIRGGENIACLDVEGALHRHPAVAEACAFSVPDDRLGEVVGAVLQIRPGMQVDQQELLDFLVDHIAKFKLPERLWMQSDPLPRGATDKIDRRAIRTACLAEITTSET